MKESIIITFLIIIIYIFLVSHNNNLTMVNTNGNKILVRSDMNDKNDSALLLNNLIEGMYVLRNYLVDNKEKYIDYKEYIELMGRNFSRSRTIIYENSSDNDYTSYSVNKGEEIIFCLRCRETHNLHSLNLIMYVAVHEMGHTACPEIGHTPLFNKIFKFLLERAVDLKLYKYENYSVSPVKYCGMSLYTNILN